MQTMDISRQLQNLAWCKPDWCFPSMSKETNELLRQCIDLPSPEINANVEEVIKKSNDFPVPFPIETVRLHMLKDRRSVDKLSTNIASTYPLIHERVLLLLTHFLIYKREFGTSIERALYKDMTVLELVDRMLKKRAVCFVGPADSYKLLSGETGNGGWETVGTLQQRPPLVLDNALSYDELKLSAMLFVSGHTEFINNGSRNNSGTVSESNIEKDGVVIGLIGTRLKKKFKVEYEDLLITEEQNTIENGYGEEVTPTTCLNVLKTSYIRNNQSAKNMWRQIWAEFYQVHSYTYEELTSNVNIPDTRDETQLYMNRYVKRPKSTDIFDNEVFYKRLIIPFDCALLEANVRGKLLDKMAYVNIVGIGLGVWRILYHQNDIFVLTLLERIRTLFKKNLLDNVSVVHITYVSVSPSISDLFNKNTAQPNSIFFDSKNHPNGGIIVHLTNREPSSKLPEDHRGDLLVTTYAWDGNAHPGNEFWFGKLTSSGDPAAACSTQVAELHNAHINNAVSGNNLHVAGSHGVLPLRDYCRKLLDS